MATTFLCIGGPLDQIRGTYNELEIKLPNFNNVYTCFNCSISSRRPTKKMLKEIAELNSGRSILVLPSAVYIYKENFRVFL